MEKNYLAIILGLSSALFRFSEVRRIDKSIRWSCCWHGWSKTPYPNADDVRPIIVMPVDLLNPPPPTLGAPKEVGEWALGCFLTTAFSTLYSFVCTTASHQAEAAVFRH